MSHQLFVVAPFVGDHHHCGCDHGQCCGCGQCHGCGGLYSSPLIPAGFWSFQQNPVESNVAGRPAIFVILVPDHSTTETGMFRGLCRNGMQWNLVVYLFSIYLLIICDVTTTTCPHPCPQQQHLHDNNTHNKNNNTHNNNSAHILGPSKDNDTNINTNTNTKNHECMSTQ